MTTKITRRTALKGVGALAATTMLARPALAQSGPIRIGYISHMSGFAQSFGNAVSHGAKIAQERINAAGGINGRQIEVVFRDDKANTEAAVGAFRELSADGIKFFVGGPISGPAVALGPLMADTPNLLIGAGPSNVSFTHEGYNPNIFRLSHSTIAFNGGIGPVMAQKHADVKKYVAIAQDAKATIDIAQTIVNSVQASVEGVEILDFPHTKGGVGDFRAQLQAFANSDAEGLITSMSGSDTVTFFKQAKAFGLDQKMKVFLDNGQELQLAKSLGKECPPSLWSPSAWYPKADPANELSKYVYDKYVAETGDKYPFGYVGAAHDAITCYAEAIRTAGSEDTDAVRTAMEQGAPMGAIGKLEFRKEDHALLNVCTYLNIVNDPAAEDGFSVREVLQLPAADLLEPATPGKVFEI